METNFLVGVLRPRQEKAAVELFNRNDNVSLKLYVPWCCSAEVYRTLADHVIREDLGFTDAMMAFVVRRWVADRTVFAKPEIDKLKKLADDERTAAFTTLNARIADVVAKLSRVDPSDDVVKRTLEVFAVKSLKPFDEMVLGAVLTKATELHAAGERDLFFCTTDGDLRTEHPPLKAGYAACGLKILGTFDVPV